MICLIYNVQCQQADRGQDTNFTKSGFFERKIKNLPALVIKVLRGVYMYCNTIMETEKYAVDVEEGNGVRKR
jgi:hypothetical protein